MAAVAATHPRWWFAPIVLMMAAVAALLTAVLPVSYFALYRNQGTLRFSRRLRLLALTAALALGGQMAAELPGWIESLGREGDRSVLTPERGSLTLGDIARLFGIMSYAAYILMMVTVYRHISDESDASAPVSKFLRVMTRVAVIAWGIWVAFRFLGLVITPFTYASLRGVALQIRRTPPPFRDMVVDAARTLFSQACLFAGPYIIWRGISQPKGGWPPAG